MVLKRTSHAVYEIKYHIVWIPKYRKGILNAPMQERLKEIFYEIAQQYEFEIDQLEVMPDHVHVFVSAPPRYSPKIHATEPKFFQKILPLRYKMPRPSGRG